MLGANFIVLNKLLYSLDIGLITYVLFYIKLLRTERSLRLIIPNLK